MWSAIGLVPQRGYLFSGTVAENLRYGKADATDDEMWEALRVAAADGFVRAHADGLDMPVAQGGINFSGGQRQRLAIARAVIRRPAIYLFDDAFSALGCAHRRTGPRGRCARSRPSQLSLLCRNAFRRSPRPIRSSSSTTGGWWAPERTRFLIAECAQYAEFADSQLVGARGAVP